MLYIMLCYGILVIYVIILFIQSYLFYRIVLINRSAMTFYNSNPGVVSVTIGKSKNYKGVNGIVVPSVIQQSCHSIAGN